MKLRFPSAIAIEASALTILGLLASAALLTGCSDGAPASVPDAGASPAAPVTSSREALPAFQLDEVDARDLVQASGQPWSAGKLQDAQPDSFSGGYSRYVLGPNGSAAIYTRADGQVWRIKLTAGAEGACGKAEAVARATEALRKLPAGRLTTGGECVRTVMVTAS